MFTVRSAPAQIVSKRAQMAARFSKIDPDNLPGKDDPDNLIGKDDPDNLTGDERSRSPSIKITKKWRKI